MRMIANIFWLGTKELRSFSHDFVLLALVIYAFSLGRDQRRRKAIRRSCIMPRSPSSMRITPNCRGESRMRSCRLISNCRS